MKDVRKAVEAGTTALQGIHADIAHYSNALVSAHDALSALAAHGICPRSITLTDRRPVITIDQPRNSAWLRGATKSRITVNGRTRSVMAAPFHGCQLEWEIYEALGRERAAHG